jgi:hypothetical protein
MFILGVCLATIYSNRLPHSIVRYPDFLRDPEGLFTSLAFPSAVPKEAFLATFDRIAASDRVGDWR